VSDPPLDGVALSLSGENFTFPASAVVAAAFFDPAWIVFVPPEVAIVCAKVVSPGEMYACVVEISTTTASAALLSCEPPVVWSESPAVLDWLSPRLPLSAEAFCCADVPVTIAVSSGVPEQPAIPVKCVPSMPVYVHDPTPVT